MSHSSVIKGDFKNCKSLLNPQISNLPILEAKTDIFRMELSFFHSDLSLKWILFLFLFIFFKAKPCNKKGILGPILFSVMPLFSRSSLFTNPLNLYENYISISLRTNARSNVQVLDVHTFRIVFCYEISYFIRSIKFLNKYIAICYTVKQYNPNIYFKPWCCTYNVKNIFSRKV